MEVMETDFIRKGENRMRLFQYEREDFTVSIISAENREEACDLLLEFEDDINPENMMPLRNLLLNLAPSCKQGNIAWGLDNMGLHTVLELPMLEQLPKEEPSNAKVINLIDFIRED